MRDPVKGAAGGFPEDHSSLMDLVLDQMDNAGRSREEMHAGPGGVELRGWKMDCVTYLGIYTIYFQTK